MVSPERCSIVQSSSWCEKREEALLRRGLFILMVVSVSWQVLREQYKELITFDVLYDPSLNLKWFSLMDDAIGGRPSIWLPCHIASTWEDSNSFLESGSPDSVLDRPDTPESWTEEEPGPAPRKRQRHDRILKLLERAKEKETWEEPREERLLSLIE